MGREDYSWVQGDKLGPGMLVFDIHSNALGDGAVLEGVGVVEDIANITPAAPSHGREFVKLHLKEVKSDRERMKYASKTKLFQAKHKA